MDSQQLPLELNLRPALGWDDFLVAPSNEDAVAWLDRWPDWPARFLAIYGPPSCGKTHLAHVWQARSAARIIQAADLTEEMVPELAEGPTIIEGCEEGVDERALFHLYNMLAAQGAGPDGEKGGWLLLTGRHAPTRWTLTLPDLKSRLGTIPSVEVGLPDDSLFAAVLVKLFADRQLRVGGELVNFLLSRMERSFAAAEKIVTDLDAAGLAEKRNITVPLARDVLQRLENEAQGEIKWI